MPLESGAGKADLPARESRVPEEAIKPRSRGVPVERMAQADGPGAVLNVSPAVDFYSVLAGLDTSLELQAVLERDYGDPRAAEARVLLSGQRDRLYTLIQPHLEVLGVPAPSDRATIEARYRELMDRFSADKFIGFPDRYQEMVRQDRERIEEAYQRLLRVLGPPAGTPGKALEGEGGAPAQEPRERLEASLRRARQALEEALITGPGRDWAEPLSDTLGGPRQALGAPSLPPGEKSKADDGSGTSNRTQAGLRHQPLQNFKGEKSRDGHDLGTESRGVRSRRKGGWLKGLPRRPRTPEEREIVAAWRAARSQGRTFSSVEELMAWKRSAAPGPRVDPGEPPVNDLVEAVVAILKEHPRGLLQQQLKDELKARCPGIHWSEPSLLLAIHLDPRIRQDPESGRFELSPAEAGVSPVQGNDGNGEEGGLGLFLQAVDRLGPRPAVTQFWPLVREQVLADPGVFSRSVLDAILWQAFRTNDRKVTNKIQKDWYGF
ncbi:MAG TPA: J domain-containing protein [Candidatus Nitrosotenuis sp.]|nr:J domain-containing protein [Candidatus Nitrosotenuis sp.]